ncbi:hypothetical protein [Amycolatopsis sp. NPDC059021]|uniref:hypothetical protein n=1 Tax=Amycolatopsis sp. NPDC059021 TaxID=3346704 RepID=UPI0036730DFF
MTVRLDVLCGWCGGRCRARTDWKTRVQRAVSTSFWQANPAEARISPVPVAPGLDNFRR